MKRWSLVLVGLGILLSACGGGGGAPSKAPTQTVVSPLFVQTTDLDVGVVNKPYSGTIALTGGTKPYTLTVQGTLPTGITFSNGQLAGTPTSAGVATFTVTGTDSSSPAQTVTRSFSIPVTSSGIVRNDSVADATVIPCCGTIHASLSPYSTATGVVKPDQDYYQIIAEAGARYRIEVDAVGTEVDTDTTLELRDSTGSTTFTCKTPAVPASFTDVCFNDDIDFSNTNSMVQIQLPASSGAFYVIVADFAHRARPEMTYDLKIQKLP
jgi:hypothetical protein